MCANRLNWLADRSWDHWILATRNKSEDFDPLLRSRKMELLIFEFTRFMLCFPQIPIIRTRKSAQTGAFGGRIGLKVMAEHGKRKKHRFSKGSGLTDSHLNEKKGDFGCYFYLMRHSSICTGSRAGNAIRCVHHPME